MRVKTQYTILPVRIPSQATLKEAIDQSGILALYPEINLEDTQQTINAVGIFGQLKDLNTTLQQNDRIEIYRSLSKSAMDQRKGKTVKIKRLRTI